jgi:cell division protein FtsB
MKVFAAILLVIVALLQIRLWVSDDGVREVRRLGKAIEAQAQANLEQREKNERLAAEVKDLKEGLAAVEERARSDLGMVGPDEKFYQVVPAEPDKTVPGGLPAASAPPPTRQARK